MNVLNCPFEEPHKKLFSEKIMNSILLPWLLKLFSSNFVYLYLGNFWSPLLMYFEISVFFSCSSKSNEEIGLYQLLNINISIQIEMSRYLLMDVGLKMVDLFYPGLKIFLLMFQKTVMHESFRWEFLRHGFSVILNDIIGISC